MSDRLTHPRRDDTPRWVSWMPLLCLGLAMAHVLQRQDILFPATAFEAPPHLKALGDGLPVQILLLLSVTGILGLSGLLLQALLPPKSPLVTRRLAQCLGISATLLWVVPSFSASPALPAWALALAAWLLFLWSAERPKALLAAPAGLLGALALTFDLQILAALPPILLWMSGALLRNPKTQLPRAAGLLAGLVIGLLPFLTGRIDFVCPYRSAPGPLHLPLLPPGTWFFIALGGIVALLQRLPVFLGLLLPAFALGLSLQLYGLSPLILPLAQSWLCAYGLFRLLKGVENGVRNLNPERAKVLPRAYLLLHLAALGAWVLLSA